MRIRHRLHQLERRAIALAAPRSQQSHDDAWIAWCRGGCVGPWLQAGPRPAKYRSEEEWQKHHRFLLALCCRSVGKPDPPEMMEDERRHVEHTLALFASIDPKGRLTLPQQARLAPYADVLTRFLSDAGGGGESPTDRCGESP